MPESIVIQEGILRQIIYTILVSWCSLTIGMCLEWTWYDDDVKTKHNLGVSESTIKTLMYVGVIISAGPAALIASMQKKLREVLIIGIFLTLCGSIIFMAFSISALLTLITGRILHGMGAGIVCVVVPNYSAEITEPKYRDVLIGLHHVHLLSGMILSHIIDEYCMYSYVNMGIVAMAILNLIALCAINDPPYFQTIFYEKLKKSELECKRINVSSNSCHNILRKRDIDKTMHVFSIFTKKQYFYPLLINICLISIQQFGGNISLLYKLQCAYGGPPLNKKMSNVTGILLVSSSFCLLSLRILKKKYILIISGLGMAITLILMNGKYYMQIIDTLWLPNLIVIYIIFYSIGYGPMPWILMPQICPRYTKLWTSGVIVSLYAFLNLIINQPFIDIIRYMIYMLSGVDIFLLIFTVVSVISIIFACLFTPKIKDRISS
ncbi:facilitated trehalose transporter Tret1-2 homolog [Melanaphis sacchari]|uniref:facilitated trehalose transporter Tret1-2 homolog n=1 Tax=Melanaphis sacchari TaxID=742174 RepID=UPI000DC14957|nr:facilitated trehalose transporter Tret1-2 homolog [Melanaphis sacchari]